MNKLALIATVSLGTIALAPPDRGAGVDPFPAEDDRCVVEINRDSAPVRVTNSSRKVCVASARLLEPEVPEITDEFLRNGRREALSAGPEDTIYCRFKPGARMGGSMKFHCVRTDENNQLLDESGRIVAGAVDFDDDGKLLDRNGKRLRDAEGRSIDGHQLRVKYFLGGEAPPRYREMFTETVVSRLFWALGVPADDVYMPESIRCFGCTENPFVQKVRVKSDTAVVFRLASIKLPYDGKKVSVPGRDGFLGLGGRYDHGWSFREVELMSNRIEAEMHALALNVVAYNNLHSIQNDLRCRRGAWDTDDGTCHDPVAYVSDIGGTLGGRRAVLVKDEHRPVMNGYPRGDYVTFTQGAVFSDPSRCKLFYEIADVEVVSEEARRRFAERVQGRLGKEQLRVILEAASIHRMERYTNELIGRRDQLAAGPARDLAVQVAWAEELHKRLMEIVYGDCTAGGEGA